MKPDPFCPDVWVKALSSVPMCCNRCGDFGWRRLRLREAMQRTCIQIIVQNKPPTEKQKAGMEGFTRHYSKLIGDFYGKPMIWEPDFPQMILSTPSKVLAFLDEFEKGVASMAGVPVVNAGPILRSKPVAA